MFNFQMFQCFGVRCLSSLLRHILDNLSRGTVFGHISFLTKDKGLLISVISAFENTSLSSQWCVRDRGISRSLLWCSLGPSTGVSVPCAIQKTLQVLFCLQSTAAQNYHVHLKSFWAFRGKPN